MTDKATALSQSNHFLLLYALAAAGGAIAYVPFLTILLPLRINNLASVNEVEWLAYLTLASAIGASIGNIFFGWLSDITLRRRIWVFVGLVASCLLIFGFAWVQRFEALIALMFLWQLTLNMMLAPLAAWAGDCVPDHQKGMLGGLLSFAPAFGALSAAIITIPGLANAEIRLVLVVVMVCVCVLPVIVFGKPIPIPDLETHPSESMDTEDAKPSSKMRIISMWGARFLLQISEAALFAFLYFWFQSIDPSMDDAKTAQLLGVTLLVAIPVAMYAGRWVDSQKRPTLPITICAALAGIGLLIMAFSQSLIFAIAGYILFKLTANVFLSLHTSETLRVLPRPERRGRDLGVFNLTNTIPSVILPWIILILVPAFGFPILLVILAIFAFLASLLLAVFASKEDEI